MTTILHPDLILAPRIARDGAAFDAIENGELVIDNGRIARLSSTRTVADGEAVAVAFPGLVDAHVHMCLSGGADPVGELKGSHDAVIAARAVKNLRRTLKAGVTTVRDMGGPRGIDIALAKAIDAGEVIGPHVVASGWALSITGGHGCGWIAFECDGADAFTKAARANLKAGAGHVKVIATGGILSEGVEPGAQQMTGAELEAAVAEARKFGVKCGAHAQGTAGINAALTAGVDTIEHGFYIDALGLELFRRNGAYLVPTFAAAVRMRERIGNGLPAFVGPKITKVQVAHDASFAAAHKAGVKLCCGTDAGTPFNRHGDVMTEVDAFIERGVSVEDAVRAATCWAAEAIGAPPTSGAGLIAEGGIADLVIVAHDPRTNPQTLRAPQRVFKAGADYTWLLSERD
jgi:imidazolonepropionase-like amidohydrolase